MPPTERAPAHGVALREEDVHDDPLIQFVRWFDEARGVVRLPEAMALATATAQGAPSVRMVLAERFDEDGFCFFSSTVSRKAEELAASGCAAALFYWDPLGRQVRLEGPVERLDPAASNAAFATRPLSARLAAHVARQSDVVADRGELEAALSALASRADAESLQRPDGWGGYRLMPRRYEFWQHREDRLHDRIVYELGTRGWRRFRLAP